MPARTERIIVVPAGNGQPVRIMRFPFWWDRAAFIEKFKDRELDTGNPIDWNLAWLLSAAEAAVWNEQGLAEFAKDPKSGDPNVQAEMRQFGSLLRQAAWVIVESNEWESGLN
jgi:hypothetical protein